MNRLILVAALLLTLLVATQYVTQTRRESNHRLLGTLRQLPNSANQTGTSIRDLRISLGDTTWVYTLTDTWHYPAYENAYVLGDQIKRFIEGVTQSYGTVIATNRQYQTQYGLGTPNMLTVTLTDSTNATRTIQIGRSLPEATTEAFMAVAENDTVFQMNADPRPILSYLRDPNRAPLVDHKIIPSALSRRSIIKISFKNPTYPIRVLDRIEIKDKAENARPQDGPTYEWHGQFNTGNRKVNINTVYAYTSYLSRLKFTDIHPAQSSTYRFGTHFIALTDESGISDTLDVGNTTPNGTYVRLRTTGQVFTLSTSKTELFFPPVALFDALPDPSPFNKAEPTNPFGLAP